jgi:hypothetical protein
VKQTSRRYEIRIQGHLAPHRLRHFEALAVRQEPSGETVITGCFRDQQALYGLLSWLRNLGATLLLVKQAEDDQAPGTPEGET